jgi:hypothetical protein
MSPCLSTVLRLAICVFHYGHEDIEKGMREKYIIIGGKLKGKE